MIWFFMFTALGMAITIFLLMLRWAFRPGWRDWLSGLALIGLLGWVSRRS